MIKRFMWYDNVMHNSSTTRLRRGGTAEGEDVPQKRCRNCILCFFFVSRRYAELNNFN